MAGGHAVLAALTATAMLLACACGGGTPASETVDWRTVVAAGDGGCGDRERARPICLQAAEQPCASERGTCEAACEPRSEPGNSEKEPALRGDIEAEPCRASCRVRDDACRERAEASCPTLCSAGDAGP